MATGSVAEALEVALAEAGQDDLVLVTGSLYTVGAARTVLVGERGLRRASASPERGKHGPGRPCRPGYGRPAPKPAWPGCEAQGRWRRAILARLWDRDSQTAHLMPGPEPPTRGGPWSYASRTPSNAGWWARSSGAWSAGACAWCGPSCATWTTRPPASHYGEHVGKPFYDSLIAHITRGPVLLAVVEGPVGTWQVVRTMMGATNPAQAAPGTIRGDLATVDDGKPDPWLGQCRVGPTRNSPVLPLGTGEDRKAP